MRLDGYLHEFDPDDEVGGGDATESAVVAGLFAGGEGVGTEASVYDDDDALAGAEIDDDFDLDAFFSELNEDDPTLPEGVTAADVRESVEFSRQMAQAVAELQAQEDHARIEAELEGLLDPLSPDFVRNTMLVQQALARGDLRIDADGRYVAAASDTVEQDAGSGAPDLDAFTLAAVPGLDSAVVPVVQAQAELVIDEIAERTGLSGEDLVATSLQVAAEMLRRGSSGGTYETDHAETGRQVSDAANVFESMVSNLDPGLDRVEVESRMRELIEPVRDATGLTGRALISKTYAEAVADLTTATEADAFQRIMARQRAGLPPLTAPPKPIRPSSREASVARVEAGRLERVAEQALRDANAAAETHEASDELEAVRRLTARSRVLRVGGSGSDA